MVSLETPSLICVQLACWPFFIMNLNMTCIFTVFFPEHAMARAPQHSLMVTCQWAVVMLARIFRDWSPQTHLCCWQGCRGRDGDVCLSNPECWPTKLPLCKEAMHMKALSCDSK